MRHRFVLALVLTPWAGVHGVSATQGTAGSAALVVDGDVTKALPLTSAELKALRTRVEVKAENGTINVSEGGSRSVRGLRRIQIVRLSK